MIAVRTLLSTVILSATLAGCVEGLPDLQMSKGDLRAAVAKRQGGSPRGATVAIASLDGAPDAVEARFSRAFAKEAPDREIMMADAASAHYLVRGYLSASPSDTGADVAFVYDIFDANDRSRVERVTDALSVPGSGTDAWALVDDRVMASLAGRSADELAAALAATPVARAALAPGQTADAGSPPDPARGN